MHFIVINKKWLFIVIGAILAFSLFFISKEALPTFKNNNNHGDDLVINMVTGEFSTTTADGKKIEAYRFDPGTIVIPKDKDVTLSIFGVNGAEHPFLIEGTDIKGTVRKGEETIVPLHFKEEGTYRLICDTHTHEGHGLSMIAYIIVD